ncbi:hypothetical protein IMCC3317_25390 [Kordia antarctica]|uniref:DUF4301 domain-containing protein n=1 Tax=Kordia antarctica TaxID=1218801 RepID=A0A7L4ZKW9_9FLAO|nr:DUF4301 family protein [Kordia antarctica]QHI37161.1 hypothetical protein IMCC3317_25390 [Kordia antarctica]
MNFSKKHTEQIEAKELTLLQIEEQLDKFRKKIPFTDITAHARVDHGILKLTSETEETYIQLYREQHGMFKIVKFTPASGAATRMFNFLYKFLETYDPKKESINSYINKEKEPEIRLFFIGLEKFPFYDDVLKIMDKTEIDKIRKPDEFNRDFVHALLAEEGLNYGNYPKGLLSFHKYKSHIATPFQEHLFEAASYACQGGKAILHFTISKQHYDKFKATEQEILPHIAQKTDCTFEISYSYQSEKTDTIAVDLKNRPILDAEKNLEFRPGGHGALIENLNAIDADLIFIKNIDNVVVNTYAEEISRYKKILAGKLIDLQQKAFKFMKMLHNGVSNDELIIVLNFLYTELNIQLSEEFEKYSQKYQIEYLIEKLNRPIRICGMVKNEGEPGGGPFWVKHENGSISLQIVESAQIDRKNEYHQGIQKLSTHFNPVDIVCGVKDYQGNKYDLTQFVDRKSYFIASKSKSGKKIKALELPGLWNGGMAFWNTVFVEVPLVTFNPVKTINDLLKPTHQVK